ncbi:MAG: tetratricopeptide repeat protein, partial [Rickettsiales bacterium]|nr:tetratricopeptide repeat protein [Rickettsiales bacterium]
AIMFAIYYSVGAPEVVTLSMEREQRILALRQQVKMFSERLKEKPEDVEAWGGLGDAFMQTGQYKGAVNAYKETVKLTNGHPKAILAFAQAQIAEANGSVTDAAKKSIEMVLLQEPKNDEARYLMALRMLQDGKADEAMKEFRDIYYHLPEDSPLKDHIDRQIGNK